jgi:hypothetical protein
MSSLLVFNPFGGKKMKRRKQPYLVNPHNPMVSLHPHIKVWRDPVSGKFGGSKKGDKKSKGYKLKFKSIMSRRAIEKDLLHHATHIPSSYVAKVHPMGRVAKRLKTVRKAKHTRKMHAAAKAAFVKRMALARAAKGRKHPMAKVARKAVKISRRKVAKKAIRKAVKITRSHRRITMAKRHKKSRKHASHKNPFSLKSMMGTAKGFISTDLLIDGSLVAVGMVASKYGVEFAAGRLPFLATPYGKLGSRLLLGFTALYSGKWIGKRYAEPIALGFIAPAILDVVEMTVPRLLPAGGVKLLESGYMPDVRSSVSLEQGYMPDVQNVAGMGDGYMPDIAPELQ